VGQSPFQRARQDAERLRARAFWTNVAQYVRGAPNELLPFEAVGRLRPFSETYGGVRAVPIKQILGSVDRYQDFSRHFLPRPSLPLERWIRVRQAGLEGKELGAIQVYQVGDVYFVKDGHHRVSAARAAGQVFIDAEVIALAVSVPPDARDTLRDIVLKGECAHFLEATGLGRLRPGHEPVRFSVLGRADVLLEHIRTHQYLLGAQLARPVAWEEGVASWYDTLYLPIVQEIERHGVLRRFPGRTQADLYLWIMDHRHYLRERYGVDLGSRLVTMHYAARYAPNRLVRGWQRLRAWRLGVAR
jgi:hypothetical protein